MGSQELAVGTADCGINTLVSIIRENEIIREDWSTFARELGIPNVKVKQLRLDFLLLSKITYDDLLTEILEYWVSSKGEKATLNALLQVLEEDCGAYGAGEVLRRTFNTIKVKKYSRIPTELHHFLVGSSNLCVLQTIDCGITCNKLKENLDNCEFHDWKGLLEQLSSVEGCSKNSIHVVTDWKFKKLKPIMPATEDGCFTKFVLLVDTSETLSEGFEKHSAAEIIHDPMDWADLSPAYQYEIVSKLETLLPLELEEEALSQLLHGKVLVDLINGREIKLLKKTLPEQLNYYVGRAVLTRSHVSNDIFEHNSSSDIFMISGIERYEMSALIKNKMTGTSGEQLREGITVQFMILEQASHFEKVSAKTSHPVHLLHYESGNLQWIQSNEGIEEIRKWVATPQNGKREEDFISELSPSSNQPVLISDSPGMGKTVLLGQVGSTLAKKHPDRTIIFLVLGELIRQIKQVAMKDDVESIKMALLNMVCENELGKRHLKTKLDSQQVAVSIELLLDGFDEVDSADYNTAHEILQVIKSSLKPVRLWVTSRPHMLEELETNLAELGYNIIPFSEDDQIEFLIKYWSYNNSNRLNQKRLEKFARECLRTLKSSMNSKDHDVAGIPLQCLLIGEVYEEEATAYANTEDDSFPPFLIKSVTDLYESLILAKFKKYDKVHVRTGPHKKVINKDDLMDTHARLSLELIFPEHFELFEDLVALVEMEEVLKLGILEASSTEKAPRFIHRTFAEYFIAWFVMNKIKRGDWNTVLRGFLLDGILKCQDIKLNLTEGRLFQIDSYLFLQPVINYFLNFLMLGDTDFQIDSNYSIFQSPPPTVDILRKVSHACANADFFQLFHFIFMKNDESTPADLQRRIVFDDKFLLVTIHKSSLKLVKLALAQYESNHQFQPRLQEKALFVAVQRGDFTLVEFLLKDKGLQKNVNQYNADYDEISELFHYLVEGSAENTVAQRRQKLQIIKMLIGMNRGLLEEKKGNALKYTPLLSSFIDVPLMIELVLLGADVFAQDSEGYTVLHLNNGRAHLQKEDYYSLMISIPEEKLSKLVHMKGENGCTPLITVLWNLDPTPETINLFSRVKADFNCLDANGYSLLALAIEYGRSSETIRMLTEYGAAIYWTGPKGESLLHVAADAGNIDATEVLVDEVMLYVNAQDEDGLTPMDYAIKSENFGFRFEASKALYQRDAKYKVVVNSEGQSWLHVAAKQGNLESIQILIYLGLSVNMVDSERNTPLHMAVTGDHRNQLPVVKLLLDNGANANKMNRMGESCFHTALKNPRLDIDSFQLLKSQTNLRWTSTIASLSLILVTRRASTLEEGTENNTFISIVRECFKQGADVDHEGVDGSTPLLIAVRNSNLKLVHLLIEMRANVNLKNNEGQTGLHIGAKYCGGGRALQIIKILIDSGCDVHAKDGSGFTFLHNYISKEVNPSTPTEFHDLVEYLIEKDMSALLFNEPGGEDEVTCLHLAVRYLEPEMRTLTLLHSHGINFNSVDKAGTSVLGYAVWGRRSVEFISTIVNRFGAEIKHLNKRMNENLLHFTADKGTAVALKLFLDLEELSVNGRNFQDNTPLHIAVKSGTDAYEKTDLLIIHGADIHSKNKEKQTPLHCAALGEDTDASLRIIQYLSLKGASMFAKDEGDCTFLHHFMTKYPSKFQFHLMVEFLTEHKFQELFTVQCGAQQVTPLHEALRFRELEGKTLVLLHVSGVNFNAVDKLGNSVLADAVNRTEDGTTLASILINRFQVDPSHLNSNEESMLHIASDVGSLQSLKLFLDLGELDVNGRNSQGQSPLHFVFHPVGKQIDVLEKCKLLVDFGADVNSKDTFGETPLHLAACVRDKEVSLEAIMFLIDNESDPLSKEEYGMNFLHAFIMGWEPPTPVMFHTLVAFLARKELICLFNDEEERLGRTPLHDAVLRLEPDHSTLSLLHSKGACFTAVDKDGDSILLYAIRGKRTPEFLSFLILYGVDWKRLNNDGNSVLHIASAVGTYDSLKFLLDLEEFDVNKVDDLGNTPLHLVLLHAKRGVMRKSKLLIERGAETNILNSKPRTALTVVLEEYKDEDPRKEKLVRILKGELISSEGEDHDDDDEDDTGSEEEDDDIPEVGFRGKMTTKTVSSFPDYIAQFNCLK